MTTGSTKRFLGRHSSSPKRIYKQTMRNEQVADRPTSASVQHAITSAIISPILAGSRASAPGSRASG